MCGGSSRICIVLMLGWRVAASAALSLLSLRVCEIVMAKFLERLLCGLFVRPELHPGDATR